MVCRRQFADEAIRLYRKVPDTRIGARMLARLTGAPVEPIPTDKPRPDNMRDLARRHEETGDHREAISLYRQAIADGDRTAVWWLADLFHRLNRVAEAVDLLLGIGDIEAWGHAVDLLGDLPEAERLRRYGVDEYGRIAEPWPAPTVPPPE